MEESRRRVSLTTGGGFIPRRHSTDDHPHRHRSLTGSTARRRRTTHLQYSSNDDDEPVNIHHMQAATPDELDLGDVFGGPPRHRAAILRRRSAADDGMYSTSSRSNNFYDQIFRPAASLRADPPPPPPLLRSRARTNCNKTGRSLPGFSIPSSYSSASGLMEEGFYDDIFGCSSNTKTSPASSSSKSKSKSTHHHYDKPADEHEDDAILSSFTSKLRPITIPIRRNRGYNYDCSPSSTVLSATEADEDVPESMNALTTTFLDLSTLPPLPTSSPDVKRIFFFGASPIMVADKKRVQVEEDEDESDVESERETEFVIKDIECRNRQETEGAAAVDEAIAWAKDKFWNRRTPTDVSDT